MSISWPQYIVEVPTLFEKMLRLHTALINAQIDADDSIVEITMQESEFIRHLAECLSNVDTPEKEQVFNDLLRCHPMLDYKELAGKIKP